MERIKLNIQKFAEVTSDSFEGRYLKLTVTEQSYSISDNTSTVKWKLESIGGSSLYYTIYNCSVALTYAKNSGDSVVNETIVNYGTVYWDTHTFPASTGSVEGTVIVKHKGDGSALPVNFSLHGRVYYRGDDNRSGSIDLTTIPRKATMNTATDFNDEGNPVITYTNNAGNSATTLQACISTSSTDGSSTISYRDIPKTGNLSYTFNLTNSERNTLRNATPNSNTLTVYFFIKTIIGGITYYDKIQKTMSIVNANPTFNNFTYEDINTTTTALTGNNQICVLGYSNIKAIISSANKATANKNANMSKYQYVISGNNPIDIAYSSSSEVSGTINNVKDGTFTVYAIDSRGNSTPKQITASTIKNYFNITLNANRSSVERSDNGVGGQVTLHYEGTFWNDSFGSVTNTITSVAYAFKKTTDTQWTTGITDITPTVNVNNFSFDGVIKSDNADYSFDIDKSYNVIVAINDELSYYEINLILNSGTPNISYADEGIALMQDYEDDRGGALQVGGDIKFPRGHDKSIEWKESNYGDKFRIIPNFIGADDSNKLKIQGTVGDYGTDPTNWKDLAYITGKSGNVEIAGKLNTGNNVNVTGSINATGDISSNGINLMGMLKFRKFESSITIPANGMSTLNMGAINVPSGYEYLGVIAKTNGYADQWVVSYSEYAGYIVAMAHSRYNGSLTNTLSCYAVYIRTDAKSSLIL